MMKHSNKLRYLGPLAAGVAALLAACTSTSVPPDPAPAVVPAQPPGQPQASVQPLPFPRTSPPSAAANPRAYRADAATHVYGLNQERIWKGRLPPQLYAIGVLQVEVDRSGSVRSLNWMRAPRHAPEVIAEIEKTVRAAAPFPVPARLGKVVWTDTWLWHKSGKFQLDTLTEGQD
jgi:protein TonB